MPWHKLRLPRRMKKKKSAVASDRIKLQRIAPMAKARPGFYGEGLIAKSGEENLLGGGGYTKRRRSTTTKKKRLEGTIGKFADETKYGLFIKKLSEDTAAKNQKRGFLES